MRSLKNYLEIIRNLEEQVPTRWPTLKVYRSGIDFGTRLEIVGGSRNIHGGVYLTRQDMFWIPAGTIGSAGTPVGDRKKARIFAEELTKICDAMDHCIEALSQLRIED